LAEVPILIKRLVRNNELEMEKRRRVFAICPQKPGGTRTKSHLTTVNRESNGTAKDNPGFGKPEGGQRKTR
jgi:hypothetical protein